MLIPIAQRDYPEAPPQINSLTPEAGLKILIAPLVPSQNFALEFSEHCRGVLRSLVVGPQNWRPASFPTSENFGVAF